MEVKDFGKPFHLALFWQNWGTTRRMQPMTACEKRR